MATVVLLLGGECTGKTALAHAIATTYTTHDVCVVPEVLRDFTEHLSRTPFQHEQQGILLEQTRLLDDAVSKSSDNGLIICDPAPLMTAVYSLQYFADPSLLPQALAAVDPGALVAWCAPDIPWEADGVHRDGPQQRDRTHQLLAEAIVPELPTGQVICVSGDLDQRVSRLAPYLS